MGCLDPAKKVTTYNWAYYFSKGLVILLRITIRSIFIKKKFGYTRLDHIYWNNEEYMEGIER